MANLNEWFTVHPRKRVDRTPLTDWAGRPMPKTLSDVYGSYSSKKAAAYEYCRMLCDKFNGERHIEVMDKFDVNVFATAAEAYKWAAKMTMMFDESCIPTKRAYIVRFHAMD